MVSFQKEPCGIFCVVLTYICILYADYCFIEHVVVPTLSNSIWGVINGLLFNMFIMLLAVSHFRATTCDPGKVPLPSTTLDFSDMHQAASLLTKDENNWTVCSRCETYRPPRAHHCRVCGRCIQKMDHHCPWINNCVGERNQKYFVLFLIYTGLTSLHAILLASISLSLPCIDCSEKYATKTRQIYVITLIIEGLIFGLFVIALLCDQNEYFGKIRRKHRKETKACRRTKTGYSFMSRCFVKFSSICNDTTAVEYVQKKPTRRNQRSRIELLMEVFGKGPSIFWFLPCSAPDLSLKNDSTSFYQV